MKNIKYILIITLFLLLNGVKGVAQSLQYDSTISDFVIKERVMLAPPKERYRIEKEHAIGDAVSTEQNAEGLMKSLSAPPPLPFNPCEVMNTSPFSGYTAMDPYDPTSNIGFEIENKDKGISNWLFFLGEHTRSSPPFEATFYDDRYYAGNMPPFASHIIWAKDLTEKVRVMNKNDHNDYVGDYPPLPPGLDPNNKHALRINRDIAFNENFEFVNYYNPSLAVMAVRKVRISKAKPYLTYKYAITIDPHPDHIGPPNHYDPFFRVKLYDENCVEICCEGLNIQTNSGDLIPGLKTNPNSPNGFFSKYKEWTTNTINFTPYFVSSGSTEEVFTISFTAAYCDGTTGESMGYALIDLEPTSGIIYTGNKCSNSTLTFNGPSGNSYLNTVGTPETVAWSVYKKVSGSYVSVNLGSTANTAPEFKYKFTDVGDYKVRLDITSGNTTMACSTSCNKYFEQEITIPNCNPIIVIIPPPVPLDTIPKKIVCNDCIQSFAPIPGEKYVLSAWVKQDNIPANGVIKYEEPSIGIKFSYASGSPAMLPLFQASGPIIDGWQKIEQEFTVPATATLISLTLNGSPTAGAGHDVYFDDIRVFPFRADMKSFVYDPTTQKLMSELDENNFATYYEYDEEGKLRRVKKETERGIMTIKEAGNNSSNR
jgi:hypothetical protein